MTTTLMSLDPQNPQPGQQWQYTDSLGTLTVTLERYEAPNWLVTETRTYDTTGTSRSYKNHIHEKAVANKKNEGAPPALTPAERAQLDYALAIETRAAEIDSAPVPPMPRADHDWQCLDCGHVWSGRKHCPACGADADEVLYHVERQ